MPDRVLCVQSKDCDILNVVGMGKLIQRLEPLELVAASLQFAHIVSLRQWVARDVNNYFGPDRF